MAGGTGLSNMDTLRKQWTIEIPLPPKPCSSNWRGHWATRSKAVKEYRQQCFSTFYAAQLHGALPATLLNSIIIHADFYLYNPTIAPGVKYAKLAGVVMPRDADNARGCLKPAQDALVDVAVVPGDSARYVRMGDTRIHSKAKDHQKRHCVILTIVEEARES